MKHFITISAILVSAMVSPKAKAQSGGFNVKNVNASENVIVGSESDKHIEITGKTITLQPLTKAEIEALEPKEGMLVYEAESKLLLVCDGVWWKRIDGQNDNYIGPPPPPPPCGSTFYDQDGNAFQSVQIGDQCWMAENLKYLPSVVGHATGSKTDSYYYVYGYDGTDVSAAKTTANYGTYGVLYNWPAAMSACPDGWHLPSDAEWQQLTDFIISDGHQWYDVYKVLKSQSGWGSSYNGTDDYGFTGLPGGNRYYVTPKFQQVGDNGYWWSATKSSGNSNADKRTLTTISWNTGASNKANGFSVRCVRNEI